MTYMFVRVLLHHKGKFEMDAWGFHVQERKYINRDSKRTGRMMHRGYFWESQTMSSLTEILFSCTSFILKILLPKKSQQGTAKQYGVHPASGTQWNQAYQKDSTYEKRYQDNIKTARLKLSEQIQAVWMLMLPVNKKEQCRTDIQLSSEISTGPQWDQMGPWQRIDTQIIVLALQRAVCLCLRLGINSRDLSPVERGNWYKMNMATEQGLRRNPARLCGCR